MMNVLCAWQTERSLKLMRVCRRIHAAEAQEFAKLLAQELKESAGADLEIVDELLAMNTGFLERDKLVRWNESGQAV